MAFIVELTEDIQKAIDSSKDVTLVFREVKPRRRLPEQTICEVKNLANSLRLTLNRAKPSVVLNLREAVFKGPAVERNFSLPLEGLNETSNHSLIVHFEDYMHDNPDSIKQRLWVFLDCVSQGYLTLNTNIFNGYRKDGGPIRAVSLPYTIVEEDLNFANNI